MDPISILSVAAAVVAFVDFGYKITKGAERHLNRKKSEEDEDTQDTLAELREKIPRASLLVNQIKEQYGWYCKRSVAAGLESDEMLLRLCNGCEEVGAELQVCVDKMSDSSSVSTSFMGTLKLGKLRQSEAPAAVDTKVMIGKLSKKLRSLQKAMMETAVTSLWSESKESLAQLRAISLRQEELTRRLEERNLLSDASPVQTDREELDIEDTAGQDAWKDIFWSEIKPIRPAETSSGTTTHEAREKESESLQRTIISSLAFSGMTDRGDAIPEAYGRTFGWIFKDRDEVAGTFGGLQWDHFPSWLKDHRQMYWITGKPGSGKSTLMKYIWGHPQLKRLLEDWTDDRPLLTASFFSWNAGTGTLQKSEDGLLRALLYQILQQRPDLVSRVSPRRWAFLKVFGTVQRFDARPWTGAELTETFEVLATLLGDMDLRLALFIDGLDEFETSDKHQHIINFIENIHVKAKAKICISSREWQQFADAFHETPSLQLQALTRKDIEYYVRDNFSRSVGFRELEQVSGEQTGNLVDKLISKANGVFLWITIVSKVLLTGMEDADTIQQLHEALDSLPPDLSDLFQGIWNKLSTTDKSVASQLLQLIDSHVGPADLTTIFAATEEDPFEACKIDSHLQQQRLTRRLRSRTKGLLEISNGRTVDFTHRTAKDWASSQWGSIIDMSPNDFDPNLRILAAKVARISHFPSRQAIHSWDGIWAEVVTCLSYGTKVEGRQPFLNELIRLLDRLDQEMEDEWERRYRRPGEHWSSTQFDFKHGTQNTFLGLAAQFSITHYVSTKVEQHPELISPRSGLPSLLENALFVPNETGRTLHITPAMWNSHQTRPESYRSQNREELVRFLVEHGADPSQNAVLFRQFGDFVPKIHSSGRYRLFESSSRNYPLHKLVNKLAYTTGNQAFWAQVTVLFEDEMKRRSFTGRVAKVIRKKG